MTTNPSSSQCWDFKYMKTDLVILQVVNKVKTEHGLVFRSRSLEDKGKNFLERYVAYAITNVKRALMENLKRNAPTETHNDGKKKKKKIITFDPKVHVKEEKPMKVCTEVMDFNIINDMTINQDTSTITMERSHDDMKSFVLDIIARHFRNGGSSVKNTDDFKSLWNQEVEGKRMINDIATVSLQDDNTMPDLSQGGEIPLTLQDIIQSDNSSAEEYSQNTNTSRFDTSINEDKYVGELKCGNCEMIQNVCSTHNEMSLTREFGPHMSCVGVGCKKTLLQCLNEGKIGARGAYICKNCKTKECRRMMCTVCYHLGKGKEEQGRARRSSKL